MAAERVTRVLVCDFEGCGRSGRGVSEYRVELPGGFIRVDLCKDHAAPLTQFVATLPKHKFIRTGRASGGRGRSTSIVPKTMEEIEEEKRRYQSQK